MHLRIRPSWLAVAASAVTALTFAASCAGGEGDASAPSPGGVADSDVTGVGKSLYARNCQACHGDQSGTGGTGQAPPHNEAGHSWHHPDAQLIDWVLNGKFPGQMPAFSDRLSREQVEAILAYIQTWWTEDQRSTQADISERYQEALDRQRRD